MKQLYIIILLIAHLSNTAQNHDFRKIKDIEALKTKINEVSKSYTTLISDFSQEKYLSFLSQKIYSTGTIKFKTPDLMKMEYTKPAPYIISFTKDKVYIKENGKVSKIDIKSNSTFKALNKTMIESFQGKLFNNKDYVAQYFENESQYYFLLEPVSETFKQYFAKVKIYMSKKDCTVNKLELIEKSGDYTLLSFSNKKLNLKIKNEEFIIK